MKYKIIVFLCTLLTVEHIFSSQDCTNQTYLFTRPCFDSISTTQAGWSSIVYNKQKHGFACQVYALYQQSFENDNLASYFLFHNKNEISIAAGTVSSAFNASPSGKAVLEAPEPGDITVKSFDRDILGQWLGLTNLDPLQFTLNPIQKQACVMFEVSQNVGKILTASFFENWFINFAIPITFVENNIQFSGDKTIADAFNNSGLHFGKIVNGDRSSTRLTQAHLSLGTKYQSENDVQIITSSGVIIPLVEQNFNASLFEPVQGYDAHFAFNTQACFQFPVMKKSPDANSAILFFFDIDCNFLARNHQLRTYDIRHKPFSRYMQLLDRHTNSLVPAANVLTIRSRVEPFDVVNLAAGFRGMYKDHAIVEIGYELWAHADETVTPEPEVHRHGCLGYWDENRYGIPFINEDGVLAQLSDMGEVEPLADGVVAWTASGSTINFIAAPDGQATGDALSSEFEFFPQNKYLTLRDLDRDCAGARSAIVHKAFANITLGQKGKVRDYFANLGIFIEISANNAALHNWGGFLKAGITF